MGLSGVPGNKIVAHLAGVTIPPSAARDFDLHAHTTYTTVVRYTLGVQPAYRGGSRALGVVTRSLRWEYSKPFGLSMVGYVAEPIVYIFFLCVWSLHAGDRVRYGCENTLF